MHRQRRSAPIFLFLSTLSGDKNKYMPRGKENAHMSCLPSHVAFLPSARVVSPCFLPIHRCVFIPPQLMDNREAAAALRESIRVNGKAQAASDEEGDSGEEEEDAPPPIKVSLSRVGFEGLTFVRPLPLYFLFLFWRPSLVDSLWVSC